MGFPIWYSKQHLSVDNMTELVNDIENQQITHLQDFHHNSGGAVLTTTYGSSAQIVFQDIIAPSLTIWVSGGVSYSEEFHRIDLKESIIGETKTSTGPSTVTTSYPIVDVAGVFTVETGAGINYYLGGQFNATGQTITLGIPLPSHPQTIYCNYDRMMNYTFTDPPTGVADPGVTRIDLLYLEYKTDNTCPHSIDFISSNRRIYQEVNYTRRVDSFEIKTIKGIQVVPPNVALYPSIPEGTDIVPLAYVHLRNNTTAIYDYDTGNIAEGYLEDIRDTI